MSERLAVLEMERDWDEAKLTNSIEDCLAALTPEQRTNIEAEEALAQQQHPAASKPEKE